MSTNDVPGANPVNNDTLKMGCWGEHKDDSLIFVKSTEGGRVIYEMFDLTQNPITVFNDAMLEDVFKKQFSWDPANPKNDKWQWHDKTPFPWNKVIKAGARDGVGYASASDQLAAASRVATALNLVPKNFDPASVSHLTEKVLTGGALSIIQRVQKAISSLPVDAAASAAAIEIKQAEVDLLKLQGPTAPAPKKGLIKRIFGR
jgi:hypothetical protein